MDSSEKNSPSLTNGSGIAFFTLVSKEREDIYSENWQREEGNVYCKQLDVDSVLTVTSPIIVMGFLLLSFWLWYLAIIRVLMYDCWPMTPIIPNNKSQKPHNDPLIVTSTRLKGCHSITRGAKTSVHFQYSRYFNKKGPGWDKSWTIISFIYNLYSNKKSSYVNVFKIGDVTH